MIHGWDGVRFCGWWPCSRPIAPTDPANDSRTATRQLYCNDTHRKLAQRERRRRRLAAAAVLSLAVAAIAGCGREPAAPEAAAAPRRGAMIAGADLDHWGQAAGLNWYGDRWEIADASTTNPQRPIDRIEYDFVYDGAFRADVSGDYATYRRVTVTWPCDPAGTPAGDPFTGANCAESLAGHLPAGEFRLAVRTHNANGWSAPHVSAAVHVFPAGTYPTATPTGQATPTATPCVDTPLGRPGPFGACYRCDGSAVAGVENRNGVCVRATTATPTPRDTPTPRPTVPYVSPTPCVNVPGGIPGPFGGCYDCAGVWVGAQPCGVSTPVPTTAVPTVVPTSTPVPPTPRPTTTPAPQPTSTPVVVYVIVTATCPPCAATATPTPSATPTRPRPTDTPVATRTPTLTPYEWPCGYFGRICTPTPTPGAPPVTPTPAICRHPFGFCYECATGRSVPCP